MKAKVSLMSLLAVCAITTAVGAEPIALEIPFSTKIPTASSRPQTIRFSLFDSPTIGLGNELWRELALLPVPASGAISHRLGSIVPFGEGMHGADPAVPAVPVDFTQQLWVEVSAGAFIRRVKLTVAPYSINSVSTNGLRVEQSSVSPNVIGGHAANSAAPDVSGAAIAGGGEAGNPNQVLGSFGAIGGGRGNQAGVRAVVGGGLQNLATGEFSSICGGIDNQATGGEASILGGAGGRATGDGATIAGGCSNTASGYRSFAAGEDAKASRRGMFVWSATDDHDPEDGDDARYIAVYEQGGGFPQELVGGIANPLLKDMQFWVKAPGGVFFVTGQDLDGNPVGVKLEKGSQAWVEITQNPRMTSNLEPRPDTAGLTPGEARSLQALVADLEKRVAELEGELAAGRAESTAMKARIEDLALRHAELRRLLAGEPRHGSELAGTEKSRVTHP
jgi:hypothetical protein